MGLVHMRRGARRGLDREGGRECCKRVRRRTPGAQGMSNSPSRRVPTSRRLRPDGVLVPFLICPRKILTDEFHPASPFSLASVPQNSARNSLGSLTVSASDLDERERNPKDLRLSL